MLGSRFEITFQGLDSAFVAASLVVVPPNNTAFIGPYIGFGMDPVISLLPPNGTANTTVVDNSLEGRCRDGLASFLTLPTFPDTVGNWTYIPYLQYFFGADGYTYQEGLPCISRPITGGYLLL